MTQTLINTNGITLEPFTPVLLHRNKMGRIHGVGDITPNMTLCGAGLSKENNTRANSEINCKRCLRIIEMKK